MERPGTPDGVIWDEAEAVGARLRLTETVACGGTTTLVATLNPLK